MERSMTLVYFMLSVSILLTSCLFYFIDCEIDDLREEMRKLHEETKK